MHFPVYSRYFYSKLSDKEKAAYDILRDDWYAYRACSVFSGSFTKREIRNVISAVFEDYPEFFYIDLAKGYKIALAPKKAIVEVVIDYTPQTINKAKDVISQFLDAFVKAAAGEKDKLDFIHSYIVQTITYSDSNEREIYTIIGALINQSAVCEGYARAFKLLCDALHIPCMVIRGSSSTYEISGETHGWNIVRWNSVNYHIDSTWNSNEYHNGEEMLYYKVSDAYIGHDHKWNHSRWPACTTPGDFEKDVVTVTSRSAAVKALINAASAHRRFIVLFLFRSFSSADEVNELMTECFNKANISDIRSYFLQLDKSLNRVLVKFRYI